MTHWLLALLCVGLAATPAVAQFQPGGPLNPWECRPVRGGGIECSSRLPDADPFAPGSPLNPWRGSPNGRWEHSLPSGDPFAPGSPLNPIRCQEIWGGRIECSSGF